MNRIAIVGMSCRLPGASSPDELWQMLVAGENAVGTVPASRWSTEEFYDSDPQAAGAMYTTRGGFLEHIDLFDPACFGIAPREALHMDPQQRLMLELAWEVFEDAGIAHQRLAGSPTGVFIGFGPMEYALTQLQNPELIDAYTNTGYFPSIISNRISYVFDLRGPSLSLDTACSASLVAVKLACDSLRRGETNLALAGGVNLMVDPTTTVAFCKLSALSPNGRCKTFDAEADGYVRGEGAGIVLLKRLDDAVRDGDRIYATILGEAITQDGRSNGLTAPNRLAQEEVLSQAYRSAGIEPNAVQYVEAHGTGTFLGDPIEVAALGNVLGRGREASNPLRIGSLKTNIGHLESAAGISGLIKLAKCIQHRTLVPHLHYEIPNPHIDFDKHRIAVVTERQPWPEHSGPIIAGISAFGFGGTNAHLVLGDGVDHLHERDECADPGSDSAQVLVLSARDPAALDAMRMQYRRFIESPNADASFAEICRAAATTRSHLEYRTSLVAGNRQQASQLLGNSLATSHRKALSRPRVGFLFTGQGAQYAGMGRELWLNKATFRKVIDECDALMLGLRHESLSSIMFDARHASRLNETQWTQPAVFALQWALYELWKLWGIEPDIVLGHSIGEIAGACAAGMMPWQEGFAFAAKRGSLMQSLDEPGGMIAILDSQLTMESLLADHQLDLEIAVSNSPTNWVLSGRLSEIDRALDITRRKRIQAVKLNVSHAFHSKLMEPILAELCQDACRIAWRPSTVPFVANLTGEVLPVGTVLSPEYFQAHARSEVKFSKSVEAFEQCRLDNCLELGPSSTLNELAKSNWTRDGLASVHFTCSLKRGTESLQAMLEAAGVLFERGHVLRWDRIYVKGSRFVSLPKYPFQRQRYWQCQPAKRFASDRTNAYSVVPVMRRGLLGNRLDAAIDIYQNELSAQSPPWINDHRVGDQIVLPGAAYLDMALSLVAENRKESGGIKEIEKIFEEVISLESIRFQAPLLFTGQVARRVQCVSQGDSISILSCHEDKKQWTKHCTAKSLSVSVDVGYDADLNAELGQSFWERAQSLTASELYDRLSEHGLQYGQAFRGIERVFSTSDEAWAEIVLSPEFSSEGSFISPMLLDSCFQAVACLVTDSAESNDRTYIPAMIQRATVVRRATGRAYCRVLNVDASGRNQLTADLHIFDEQKRPIAKIEKLRLIAAKLPRPTSTDETKHWVRKEEWGVIDVPSSVSSDHDLRQPPSIELISIRESVVLDSLKANLTIRDAYCVQSTQLKAYELATECNGVQNTPTPTTNSTIVIVLEHPWMHGIEQEAFSVAREQVQCLHLWLKNNANNTHIHRIIFLTTAGLWTGTPTQSISVATHSMVGWIRSIRFEFPKWRIDHLDFETSQDVIDQAGSVAAWIESTSTSPEVAYRDGRWYRRVWNGQPHDLAPHDSESIIEQGDRSDNDAIVFEQKGSIDFLAFGQKQRGAPAADEVEIAIHSTGLNFRDVLNILGMYPGDAGPLGGECSGTVTRVGSCATGLQPGDRVAAILSGAFSNFGIAKAALTAKLPNSIALATGAGLPIAFATAALAIKHFGKLKSRERVLVHAGTGGVGLAAIQLALNSGAEVYATAGSERKRRYLSSLGVKQVWNSRDKNLAESIVAQLGKRPFDVVLNSLSGDFIPSSMSLLNSSGRFVEIGKIGIWSPDAVAMRFPDIEYHPFDLAELSKQQPVWIGQILRDLIGDYANWKTDYPVHSVPFTQARDAFRFMSQAKHIGKLVVTQPRHSSSSKLFETDAMYVVTGAMGGIGRQFVPWMIEQGAKHIELWMHRPLDSSELTLIAQWSVADTTISVRQVNGASCDEVDRAIDSLSSSSQRLAGVFHLAGVLQDSLVVNSDWEAYEQVLRAKAEYAWFLHRSTENLDLDYFVLFSSMTSLFGSPAQANYAMANSFLDALALARRSTGKSAHSIQWGPWRGAGMAAEFDRRAAAMGIRLLDGAKALQCLTRILRSETAVTSVIDLEQEKFASSLGRYLTDQGSSATSSSRENHQASTTPRGNSLELVIGWKSKLDQTDLDQRPAVMMAMVQSVVTKVLGLPEKTMLDLRQPLRELGLDSLMAVEVRNLLVEIVSFELDSTVLFDHPTIESLACYLSQLAGERVDEAQQLDIIASPSLLSAVERSSEPTDDLANLTTHDLADELARELKLLSGETRR